MGKNGLVAAGRRHRTDRGTGLGGVGRRRIRHGTGGRSGPAPVGAGTGGVRPGAAIPPAWLTLYQQAAATCPGLAWSVLAAIGTVEIGSGQSTAPGVSVRGQPRRGRRPDAVRASHLRRLRHGRARRGPTAVPVRPGRRRLHGGGPAVRQRGRLARHPAGRRPRLQPLRPPTSTPCWPSPSPSQQDPSTSGTVVAALSFAAQQLGTPYVWGGTGAGGFDCSGLVQAAYGRAGVTLPRVAQDQFDAGPAVPAGTAVEPGDLVFFGSGPAGRRARGPLRRRRQDDRRPPHRRPCPFRRAGRPDWSGPPVRAEFGHPGRSLPTLHSGRLSGNRSPLKEGTCFSSTGPTQGSTRGTLEE